MQEQRHTLNPNSTYITTNMDVLTEQKLPLDSVCLFVTCMQAPVTTTPCFHNMVQEEIIITKF